MRKILKKTALLLSLSILCCQPLYSCGDKQSESGSTADESIQHTTNEAEAELGEYVFSESGLKLYYSEDEFAEEVDAAGIAAALETYFTAYAANDYNSYLECVHPEYISEMEKYLEKEYGYGLEKSFETQCDNLKVTAGGDYKLTRIKVEAPEEDSSESYLDQLGELFGTDFYETVKADSDAVYNVIFYVMAERGGEEVLLVSGYEIVFAEKDGKLYAFG